MSNYYLNHTGAQLDEAIQKVRSGYKDVSGVTATAEDVKVGTTFVTSDGVLTEGTLELGSGGSSLYTELLYIESTGTQYIDTGIIPNQDTRVVVDVQFSEFPTAHSTLFGSNDNTNAYWAYYRYSDNQYRAINGGTTQRKIDFADPTQRVTVSLESGLYTVGENQISFTTANFNNGLNMYLFALNRNNTVYYPSSNKMFSCQIYDNGILVRDYIPVRYCTGEIGLYDLVEGKFYCNAGTGEFIAGVPITQLPDGCTQVGYIQTSGTQYIDTGFTPTGKSRMVLDFTATDISVTNNNIIGTRNTTSSSVFTFSTTSGKWRMGYNNASTTTSVDADTNRHIADFNKNVLNLDGTTIYTATVAEFTAYSSIYIGAIHASSTGYLGYVKFYSCQIYDNGTLVRDYIPVLDSNKIPCLYDKVNQQMYYNKGTGNFTYA